MATYELLVNGVSHQVDAAPDMPLLTVLRELLGITGPKYGCGTGLCGACMCQVSGRATRSCILPLAAVGSQPVVTIEGLADDAGLHPLQQAWVDTDVAQCGFCQQGQIMRAAVLLAENPDPSDADIDAAMSDVICRCGTYVRVRAAVKQAAASLRGAQERSLSASA